MQLRLGNAANEGFGYGHGNAPGQAGRLAGLPRDLQSRDRRPEDKRMAPVRGLIAAASHCSAPAACATRRRREARRHGHRLRPRLLGAEGSARRTDRIIPPPAARPRPEESLEGQIADVSTGDWITIAAFRFARTGERAPSTPATCPNSRAHTRIDPRRLAASFDWARAETGGRLAAYRRTRAIAQLSLRRRRRRTRLRSGLSAPSLTRRWSSPCSMANATAAIDRISSIPFRRF